MPMGWKRSTHFAVAMVSSGDVFLAILSILPPIPPPAYPEASTRPAAQSPALPRHNTGPGTLSTICLQRSQHWDVSYRRHVFRGIAEFTKTEVPDQDASVRSAQHLHTCGQPTSSPRHGVSATTAAADDAMHADVALELGRLLCCHTRHSSLLPNNRFRGMLISVQALE